MTTAAAELEDATLEGSGVATAGSWQETHLLCRHLGCRYFGRPEADDAATAAAHELLRAFEVGGGQLRLLHRVAR